MAQVTDVKDIFSPSDGQTGSYQNISQRATPANRLPNIVGVSNNICRLLVVD